ncbi:MAG: amidase [Sphaerobacteraceae bacterium]|nr:MAG: amidase [Sphaerobacteraceae bacterium]
MSEDRRLAFASVRELGTMLRNGETTPTYLAEFFIERLERIGSELNAVVTITRDLAMREARLAEEELAAGHDRGPLHGIPYGAKDLLATAGIPTTWGCAPLQDQIFSYDAAVIERLRNAGAVLVAKLAMVELAGGMGYRQPNASFTGPGVNPWNTDAWSGGSSSGSGSAVGAGCVPFAIGSETMGSILGPAGFCGVSGLRPTYGRVSRRGAMALSWTLDKVGPLCRTADDCGLVLDMIAGPDPNEPTTLTTPFHYRPDRDRSAGFRVGVLREGVRETQPDIRDNFERSLNDLARIGSLEEVTLPDFPYGPTAEVIIRSEGTAALEPLIASGKIKELTAPEDRTGGFAGYAIPAVDYLRAMRIRTHIIAEIDTLFSRYDAIVHPSFDMVAAPLEGSFEEYRGGRRWTTLSAAGNLTGIPAITVPNGFGDRNLPTGVQFVGRAGEDGRLLSVARAYQQQTSWHTRFPSW